MCHGAVDIDVRSGSRSSSSNSRITVQRGRGRAGFGQQARDARVKAAAAPVLGERGRGRDERQPAAMELLPLLLLLRLSLVPVPLYVCHVYAVLLLPRRRGRLLHQGGEDGTTRGDWGQSAWRQSTPHTQTVIHNGFGTTKTTRANRGWTTTATIES